MKRDSRLIVHARMVGINIAVFVINFSSLSGSAKRLASVSAINTHPMVGRLTQNSALGDPGTKPNNQKNKYLIIHIILNALKRIPIGIAAPIYHFVQVACNTIAISASLNGLLKHCGPLI